MRARRTFRGCAADIAREVSIMPSLRVDAVRAQVLDTARTELAVAAGGNVLIARREEHALPVDLRDVVGEVRRRDPGKSVSVSEAMDVFADRVDAGIASVNQ